MPALTGLWYECPIGGVLIKVHPRNTPRGRDHRFRPAGRSAGSVYAMRDLDQCYTTTPIIQQQVAA